MTQQACVFAPHDGRFRPESMSHFKDVSQNMAWLLERTVQKCQEDLARIYGYSGLHELQQVMKTPGNPGPFAPRYNFYAGDAGGVVEQQEKRIFYVLFGVTKDYHREYSLAKDRHFLVFEMGLFQEAAEHRACFEKIRQVVSWHVDPKKWPLINGWPLGLRSWLVSEYTEPFTLVEGWQKAMPKPRYAPLGRADIGWQRRTTGLHRLATIFRLLAPRVAGRKPNGLGKIDFNEFHDEGEGIIDSSWESYYLVEWLAAKLSAEGSTAAQQGEDLIKKFVERPSRATAAACEYVKTIKDPVAFRDRWAFESIKAQLGDDGKYDTKALFQSSLSDGFIQSLFLHMDSESKSVGDSYSGQLWLLDCTWSLVNEPECKSSAPSLQPLIHAHGSLVIPFNHDLQVMSDASWYFSHDMSEFASEMAAVAFEEKYLPAIGINKLDFLVYERDSLGYSIVEIDEILLTESVNVDNLKSFFERFLDLFDDQHLPDSYGHWCQPLSLDFYDREEYEALNQDMEYADLVGRPSVLLINIDGCGLTFVDAVHQDGSMVSRLTADPKRKATNSGKALASMVIEAVKEIEVDVVIYDGGYSR